MFSNKTYLDNAYQKSLKYYRNVFLRLKSTVGTTEFPLKKKEKLFIIICIMLNLPYIMEKRGLLNCDNVKKHIRLD